MLRLKTIIAFLCVLICGSAVVAAANGSEIYEGTIQRVGDDTVTLRDATDEHTFLVSDDTLILMDGVPIALNDLGAGQFAAVSCEHQGERLLAKMITAHFRRCSGTIGRTQSGTIGRTQNSRYSHW